jgi:hypothetical protein
MLRDGLILVSSAAVSYLWLCAIVSPLATAVRAIARRGADRTAWTALGLAAAAAAIWTVAAAAVLFPMHSDILWRGISFGNIVWAGRLIAFARVPRLGPRFETATVLAMVAFVRNDPWAIPRVERLYLVHAVVPVTADNERQARRAGAVLSGVPREA